MSVMISDRTEQIEVIEERLTPGPLAEEGWFLQEARPQQRPEVTPAAPREVTQAVQAPAPSVEDVNRERILSGLLRMADAYRATGSIHQALEMYFTLMREHDETPQASAALARVLDVAESYERAGELRQARSIYEQLL